MAICFYPARPAYMSVRHNSPQNTPSDPVCTRGSPGGLSACIALVSPPPPIITTLLCIGLLCYCTPRWLQNWICSSHHHQCYDFFSCLPEYFRWGNKDSSCMRGESGWLMLALLLLSFPTPCSMPIFQLNTFLFHGPAVVSQSLVSQLPKEESAGSPVLQGGRLMFSLLSLFFLLLINTEVCSTYLQT